MTKTSFVGLVDEAQGMHRASPIKPVAVAFVTEEVSDSWSTKVAHDGGETNSMSLFLVAGGRLVCMASISRGRDPE